MQRAILLSLLLSAVTSLPAHAALTLCNRTSYILYAATSAVSGTASQTQGWTRLVPGDCQVAIKTSLAGQSILVYARSALAHSGPQRAWGGNFPSCVRDGNFALRQAVGSYCREDAFSVPFAAINTQGRADWTMTLDEQSAYSSLTAAQLAGAKRLLKDNGFAVGTINGLPDKATGKSLTQFRTRMHFDTTAGNDALFAALEAGALKNTAPAGYTVCNDGSEDLLVAMGETAGKVPVSRGWWPIAPGTCARTITTPLAGDAYLLAQKRNGVAVVSGGDKFCVAPQEFEIQGRNNCAARSYVEAGFARTAAKSSSGGYIAHISGSGLVPPPHALTSK